MERFYFEILSGNSSISDPEGQDFQDLSRAKLEAELSLRDLVAFDITCIRQLDSRSIKITNVAGKLLALVGVSTVMEWTRA
jgi:hypothetical protein